MHAMVIALTIAGLACLAYGLSVMLVWSGTGFFAVWFALGAVLLGGAWAVHAGWWSASPLALRRLVLGIAAVAVAVCAVTQGLALSCFGAQGDDDLDYVIVLGALVRDNGPSTTLRFRLDRAIEYLNANPRTRCIVSGGQGPNEPTSEAEAMRDYLVENGIDPARVQTEPDSSNTIENICNCKSLLDPATDRVGIITNNFHVFRSLALARKQGYQHVCGISAYSAPWYLPNNLLRETFGISKDFLQGNL